MISKYLLNMVKTKIPNISHTELRALRSVNASIDRSILLGRFELPKKRQSLYNKFPESKLNNLLNNYTGENIYPNKNSNYLSKNKFFSFLIDEKYGGIKLNVNELFDMLIKITSVDPALGVVTMVPNSLGPGELLSRYRTGYQTEKYLPVLATGTYGPCFGLMGPDNGCDATDSIDD